MTGSPAVGARRAPAAGAAVLAILLATAVAACGGGSGGSSGASGSPGTSGSSGTSATPAASVDGDELARSFVAILSDPALHASVVQQATAVSQLGDESLDLRVTMAGDLALPDLDLALVVETEGQSTRVRVLVAGDRSFVDLGEGWVEAPPGTFATNEFSDALVVVDDPSALDYAGTQEIGGRTLYHLVANRALPYSAAGFGDTGEMAGTIDDLDAYVEADGTPVAIELSFTAEGTTDGTPARVLGTTSIEFDDVGGDQVIVAPSVAPSPSPSMAP